MQHTIIWSFSRLEGTITSKKVFPNQNAYIFTDESKKDFVIVNYHLAWNIVKSGFFMGIVIISNYL